MWEVLSGGASGCICWLVGAGEEGRECCEGEILLAFSSFCCFCFFSGCASCDCWPLVSPESEPVDPTKVTELRLLGEHGALNIVTSGKKHWEQCYIFRNNEFLFYVLPVSVSLLLDAVTLGILKRLESCLSSDWTIFMETAFCAAERLVALVPGFGEVFCGGDTIWGGLPSRMLPRSWLPSSSMKHWCFITSLLCTNSLPIWIIYKKRINICMHSPSYFNWRFGSMFEYIVYWTSPHLCAS